MGYDVELVDSCRRRMKIALPRVTSFDLNVGGGVAGDSSHHTISWSQRELQNATAVHPVHKRCILQQCAYMDDWPGTRITAGVQKILTAGVRGEK